MMKPSTDSGSLSIRLSRHWLSNDSSGQGSLADMPYTRDFWSYRQGLKTLFVSRSDLLGELERSPRRPSRNWAMPTSKEKGRRKGIEGGERKRREGRERTTCIQHYFRPWLHIQGLNWKSSGCFVPSVILCCILLLHIALS